MLYVTDALPAFVPVWRIVQKEATLLEKIRSRLSVQEIDGAWVERLDQEEDLAERVEAFASRFGRLQDQIGHKLFPCLLALVGQRGRSLIDVLGQVERLGVLNSTQDWLTWRALRNMLVHEYVEEAETFADALNTALDYANNLLAIVVAIEQWLLTLGLDQKRLARFSVR